MQKDVLLKMFKEANPDLMALSPIIEVDEITESSSSANSEITVYDPPLLLLKVSHTFIFDNRLIPTGFHGIKVMNIIIGKFPLEFPEPQTDMPLEDYYNPERYIKFINRNISFIRKELKRPDLSKEEALKALTIK